MARDLSPFFYRVQKPKTQKTGDFIRDKRHIYAVYDGFLGAFFLVLCPAEIRDKRHLYAVCDGFLGGFLGGKFARILCAINGIRMRVTTVF